jgi:hypothetical protein
MKDLDEFDNQGKSKGQIKYSEDMAALCLMLGSALAILAAVITYILNY